METAYAYTSPGPDYLTRGPRRYPGNPVSLAARAFPSAYGWSSQVVNPSSDTDFTSLANLSVDNELYAGPQVSSASSSAYSHNRAFAFSPSNHGPQVPSASSSAYSHNRASAFSPSNHGPQVSSASSSAYSHNRASAFSPSNHEPQRTTKAHRSNQRTRRSSHRPRPVQRLSTVKEETDTARRQQHEERASPAADLPAVKEETDTARRKQHEEAESPAADLPKPGELCRWLRLRSACVPITFVLLVAAAAIGGVVAYFVMTSRDPVPWLTRVVGEVEVDQSFHPAMTNTSSQPFVDFSDTFCSNVTVVLDQSGLQTDRCTVNSLRNGSIIVTFELDLQTTFRLTAASFLSNLSQDALTAGRGQGHLVAIGDLQVFADSVKVISLTSTPSSQTNAAEVTTAPDNNIKTTAMNTTKTTTAPVNPDSHNTMTTLPATEQRQLASDTRQTDDSQKTAATTVSPAMTGMGCHLLDKRIVQNNRSLYECTDGDGHRQYIAHPNTTRDCGLHVRCIPSDPHHYTRLPNYCAKGAHFSLVLESAPCVKEGSPDSFCQQMELAKKCRLAG